MNNTTYKNNFWNKFALKYDAFISKRAAQTYNKIKTQLHEEIKKENQILEIGTGTGIFAFELAECAQNILAIDFAPEMIRLAKKKQSENGKHNISFQTGDAARLESPDNSMDVVVAVNLFHLLENPHTALQEAKRVLKKGGKLIIPTFCHGENTKSRILSSLMSLAGFKAATKWTCLGFKTFIQTANLEITKEHIIADKIPLNFIVALKN